MEFLESIRLRPGARVTWLGRNYDETVALRVNGLPLQLGFAAARRVWAVKVRRAVKARMGRQNKVGFLGPSQLCIKAAHRAAHVSQLFPGSQY